MLSQLNNIRTIHNKDEVFIYNLINNQGIIVKDEIYEIIESSKNMEELRAVALEYNDEDKEFINSLANIIEEKRMFMDVQVKELERIDFLVTDYCNLKCRHCCYSAFYIDEKNSNELQNIKIDINLLSKIIELNPRQITLTGGEPLLAKNLGKAMNYLKDNYNGFLALSTNGTLIREDNVSELVSVFDAFDLSIDGITKEKADYIRGVGTFEKVLKSVELLKKNNAKSISLSIALDNDTYADEPIFNKMCDNLGVTPIVRLMNKIGRAKVNQEGSEKIIHFMNDVDYGKILYRYRCPGGVSELSVNSKGDVFPCNLFVEDRFKIGNLYTDDIRNKLNWNIENSWFSNFSEYISETREECKDCDINIFCWSCPSLAKVHLENNNIESFRDICEDKYNKIRSAIWDEW